MVRGIFACMVVSLVACADSDKDDQPDNTQTPVAASPSNPPARFDCPTARTGVAPTATTLIDLARDVALVTKITIAPNNEVHDCQKLIDPETGAFGSAVALLVKAAAEGDTYEQPTTVAIAFNYGAEFRSLKIAEGYNCVVLKSGDDADGGWEAWMVPVMDTTACVRPVTTAETKLNLYRAPQDRQREVAGRWVQINDRTYIGIQCGNRFCMLGVPVDGVKPSGGKWDAEAEGDHQRLAVMRNETLVPSNLWGKITAKRDIQGRNDTLTYMNRWTTVAEIQFQGDDNDARRDYAKRLGFGTSAGDLPDRPYLVQVRYVSAPPAASYWEAQYVRLNTPGTTPASTPTPVKRVAWTPAMHSGHGTARWSWDSMDEKVWVQCATGCCLIDD
jgi:hypothetical protein